MCHSTPSLPPVSASTTIADSSFSLPLVEERAILNFFKLFLLGKDPVGFSRQAVDVNTARNCFSVSAADLCVALNVVLYLKGNTFFEMYGFYYILCCYCSF